MYSFYSCHRFDGQGITCYFCILIIVMTVQEIEKQQLKLVRNIRRGVWKAQEEFEIIEPGDKIMVCLSGGKDSYTLLDMVIHMQLVRNYDFELIAVNLDQKQPGFPGHVLPDYLDSLNIPYTILEKDTYSIVSEKIPEGKTMCSLCSRLRRGSLYSYAKEVGANKIALGHHREDALETFFLNIFFNGKIESMPAKYKTDDEELVVIRPLIYCKEEEIAQYAHFREFPIIPCNLCGSQPKLQRKMIKQLLESWEGEYPGRKEIIMTALKNIHSSHLFDKNMYDFNSFMRIAQSNDVGQAF